MKKELQPDARPLLFMPLDLRGVRLPNRIVISPMCQYSARDGHANDWHFAHLAQFAMGGAGLIFTEAVAVEARGRITHGDLGLWSDQYVPWFRRMADFIKQQGSVPAIQLGHAGRKACMQRPWYGNGALGRADIERGDRPWPIVAHGSNALGEGWPVPHELAIAELDQVRDAFRSAAQRALAAGFDVAEVHGAHGYLLHGFLSPLSNRRSDRYGGSLENRMRFPLEVAEAVRSVWPEEKPLFFRVSAIDDFEGGWSIEDSIVLARGLKARGVDVVDCSSGGILGAATAAAKPLTPRVLGFQVPFAERVRREAQINTMAVGLIVGARQAEQALREGRADLIAIGREALYDPRWALHAARELGCDPDFDLWPEQYGWWLRQREPLLRKLLAETPEA
ncbi:MAG: NADH:flavin oxidoreductase / NADH oxidase [Betaproteobacteria bacterium RIFCSPLOWO2_02_FULL_65_24]|nr:MAG: NADH:flavin oxidoreductase / NADH oxidase [Betaproteobacteria bacterium RIFCSPLOWO2_02_FULL_65_24]